MTLIDAWMQTMKTWLLIVATYAELCFKRRRVVSLRKRPPAPAVWIEPDETWGATLAQVSHEMAAVVLLTKSIEMQSRRRLYRAVVAEERAARQRLVTDELGTWDPDAVDWAAPAIYIELGRQAFITGLAAMSPSC